MKKKNKLLIICLVLLLVGCKSQEQSIQKTSNNQTQEKSKLLIKDKKVLIAYFTRAQNIDVPSDVDTSSSASLLERDDKITGNTGFVAEVIHEEIGGTLFPITMSDKYVSDYDSLVDIAQDEGNKKVRPKLSSKVENIDQYDVVFLGYPNWWYDMPMAVYTFLEENNLSNKTIIPFVTHGGSKFSNTIEILKTTLSQSNVLDGLEVYQHDVVNSEKDIKEWLKNIQK